MKIEFISATLRAVSIILVFIGLIFIILNAFDIKRGAGEKRGKHLIMSVTLCILSSMLLFASANIDRIVISDETRELRTSYTVYLDGEEIDPDKIDLSLYTVKYDDEKGIVYATARNDRGDNGLLYGFIGYMIGSQK